MKLQLKKVGDRLQLEGTSEYNSVVPIVVIESGHIYRWRSLLLEESGIKIGYDKIILENEDETNE